MLYGAFFPLPSPFSPKKTKEEILTLFMIFPLIWYLWSWMIGESMMHFAMEFFSNTETEKLMKGCRNIGGYDIQFSLTKHNLKRGRNANVLFTYMQAQQLLSHFRNQREGAAGKGKSWRQFWLFCCPVLTCLSQVSLFLSLLFCIFYSF